ncbi:MAG TPA: alpha/beta hydrolase [Burkholderiaceae bacterium]|nr:alpha/beta hydrolase [Burkholderiaceae bacterium]
MGTWARMVAIGVVTAGVAGTQAQVQKMTSEPVLRVVQSNGIRMRIAEQGAGPLVLLLHGWPESWYSWRYQIPALAQAGYHVVAPDMRGFGGTEAPPAIEDYAIQKLTADVAGLIDALGEKQAIVIGHDWGASVAWYCMLLNPERYRAIVAMSVPLRPRTSEPPTTVLRRVYGTRFFYQLYFQQPGLAEKELDGDPREFLSRIYASPDTPRRPPELTNPDASSGGWTLRLGKPTAAVPWLSAADLDYYVAEFQRTGFRGGLNYYRNYDRNWETTAQLADAVITAPTLFLAGEKDLVIAGATKDQLVALMSNRVKNLRGIELYAGGGHWVQQERAAEVNEAVIRFLKSLPPP